MQLATESKTLDNPPESIDTLVAYIEDGNYKKRHFDLATHNDRVGFSKFCLWAMNNRIELRVNRTI